MHGIQIDVDSAGSSTGAHQKSLWKIQIGRPQQVALLLLLLFLAQCIWVVHRQELSPADYRFAMCGRQMWERPSPLAGYFTTCGNMDGDGTFAYRVAGLPLTTERLVLLGIDQFRSPQNRLYAHGTLNGTTWEARHELISVKYLLHLPFVFFAIWLGAGLWWVARRLFGNEGGAFALGLYCFCPAVVRFAVTPNNDVLAMWGLYGLVYTAIGVAHAMQGPRRKWRPRIVLLTVAMGLTATAHLLAAMIGWLLALVFMLYLAERRRSYVMEVLIYSGVGSLVIVFASYAFRLAPFSYVFTGGSARFLLSLDGARRFFIDAANGPITVAALVALVLFLTVKRCRYFGNLAPLFAVALLFPVMTTQTVARPWLWALPFLLTFIGGVFADVLETRQRRLFLGLAGAVMVTQVLVCVAMLPSIAL
ncbi:hypothetical protein GCM10011507_23090 [Edaphobacter acidisoli]|uniref:Uncharacterized protein n=1 Tax=Edaphobacter acidisoli TaxID=2040573 RepID=A0A916W6T1_9BACT|nr:hypothetical protein [Edaphobacter acidisoli]GGA70896.1 hypothetical protein GCM10011507_23090 [Edaphobacter acidisoli]